MACFFCLLGKPQLMSGDKKKDHQHGQPHNGDNEPYELYYLEEKLGVSREQVKAAISVVGNNRHLVEGYLRNPDNFSKDV